ncbi:hypothetical protein LCGC14_2235590 [marine sediment metagenome]|uniref:Uncharacterized protein n=1 Tax=marine sediment metagenome TaxID=412755 RepID=A0A0F9FJJ8_9ZZZZ
MAKINANDYTKAGLCDYATTHFGVTINRKKNRTHVVKEFKKAEREYIREQQLQEDGQKEATIKKQKDADKIAEKDAMEEDETVNYPVEMKNEEGDTIMHRPNKGGIALGDPINGQEIDGESITNSAPHLNK